MLPVPCNSYLEISPPSRIRPHTGASRSVVAASLFRLLFSPLILSFLEHHLTVNLSFVISKPIHCDLQSLIMSTQEVNGESRHTFPESRVLIIGTGGTICMQQGPDGLAPRDGFLDNAMAPRPSFNDASPRGKFGVLMLRCKTSQGSRDGS